MEPRRWRLPVGRRVRLADHDPSDTRPFRGSKKAAEAELERMTKELDRLQELLYADGRFGLLVVLQGMDTAGKDGTIRHVFEGVNPQGVSVRSFKVPSVEEAAHDFLWRVHPHAPRKGEIAIFNRSQYEDVLVARVHRLVPRKVWEARYRSINEFERALVEEGTTVLKFFLNVSPQEQGRRLQERLDDPTKRWKLSPSDLKERAFWPQYVASYEEMLARTSTDWAPWYVVPSDHKWFRNLVVSTVLTGTLGGLGLRYPKPPEGLEGARVGPIERPKP